MLTLKIPSNAHDSVVAEQERFEPGQLGKALQSCDDIV